MASHDLTPQFRGATAFCIHEVTFACAGLWFDTEAALEYSPAAILERSRF